MSRHTRELTCQPQSSVALSPSDESAFPRRAPPQPFALTIPRRTKGARAPVSVEFLLFFLLCYCVSLSRCLAAESAVGQAEKRVGSRDFSSACQQIKHAACSGRRAHALALMPRGRARGDDGFPSALTPGTGYSSYYRVQCRRACVHPNSSAATSAFLRGASNAHCPLVLGFLATAEQRCSPAGSQNGQHSTSTRALME